MRRWGNLPNRSGGGYDLLKENLEDVEKIVEHVENYHAEGSDSRTMYTNATLIQSIC